MVKEAILAYLESFLATSFEEAFPINENIIINMDFQEIDSDFNVNIGGKSYIAIAVNKSASFNGNYFRQLMEELVPQIVGRSFMFKDIKEFLDNLYNKDEVNERLSLIQEHFSFTTNILTNKPKIFMKDWKSGEIKEYDLLRTESPIKFDKELQKLPNQESNGKKRKETLKNMSHKKIKAETVIDNEMWDNASWKGFGFFKSADIPFGLMLSFENAEYGQNVFKDWIEKYGKTDTNDIISITLVKGVDKNNPHWYKVLISKNIDKNLFEEGSLFSIASRFHRMEPMDGKNLNLIITGFKLHKGYTLIPTHVDSSFKITPYFELGIVKTNLKVIDAWEIGVNDFERVVIDEEDDPIIPDNIDNAPIIEVLKDKKNQKDK